MNNKTLTIGIIFGALVFTACKKERTCSCTVTKTGTATTTGKVSQELFGFPIDLADTTFSRNILDVQVFDRKIEKATKSTAKQNCISYTEPFDEKTMVAVPASSFNLSVEVREYGTKEVDCKLK